MSESKKVALLAESEDKCTCTVFSTCEFCKQMPARNQIKADLVKADAARDRMVADGHAIMQVNNAALKLADKNPKAMFLVEWERNEDGNMKKGKKQDQRAKVLSNYFSVLIACLYVKYIFTI